MGFLKMLCHITELIVRKSNMKYLIVVLHLVLLQEILTMLQIIPMVWILITLMVKLKLSSGTWEWKFILNMLQTAWSQRTQI